MKKRSEDEIEADLRKKVKEVKAKAEEVGFVEYYFIGRNVFQERVSTFSIGNEGEGFGFSNATAIDNMIGAMMRQIIAWQVQGMAANGELRIEDEPR